MTRSVAPPEHAIEVTVDVVALVDVLRAHRAWLSALQLHVTRGAERFQDRIEALGRPRKLLTQAGNGDPVVAWADTVIGRPELPTQVFRVYKAGQLLLVVKPVAQRRAHGGVA